LSKSIGTATKYWQTREMVHGRKPRAYVRDAGAELVRVCAHGWFSQEDVDSDTHDISSGWDYYTFYLKTKPEFGCVHHEPSAEPV
jgi:hypothetical protein